MTRNSKFLLCAILPLELLCAAAPPGTALASSRVVWKAPHAKGVVIQKPIHKTVVRQAPPHRLHPVRAPRSRVYSGIHVVRPHGHSYFGFGYYGNDADAFAYLGLSAMTLAIADYISENQQRAHEQALIEATQADIGEVILWNDGEVSGQVNVVRTGQTAIGSQCREFQQSVTIGGKSETAYGTACQGADGAWRIVS